MDKTGIIEERKQYNAPFLRAFFYLASEKKMNQKTFAQVINAESSYISALKAGTKRVGMEYMNRLSNAFTVHFNDEQHLNMSYLTGKSPYMILENVPLEEYHNKMKREYNPDYEAMKRDGRIQSEPSSIASEPANDTYNAIPSWASTLIEILSKQIKENEALHRELRQSIQEVSQLKTDLQTAINILKK